MQRYLRTSVLLALASLSLHATPDWDAAPWLADLEQVRTAIDAAYPNRDWLTGQREVSLDQWFGRAADAIRQGGSDAEARRVLERLVERFNDGHLTLTWPKPNTSSGEPRPATTFLPSSTIFSFCTARGFTAGQVTDGTAKAMPGYRSINAGGPFPAGTIRMDRTTLGVIRIGAFSSQSYPELCEQAIVDARIAIAEPCDDACDDRVLTEAYALMTRGLMNTVERLRAAGAQVLLIDLTRNGGGSE